MSEEIKRVTEALGNLKKAASKKTICVDFDGVIHSYDSGWQGHDKAVDPPVPGAIEWLQNAVDRFDIQIYSSRSQHEKGVDAMKDWLILHGLGADTLAKIKFPTQKPAAFLTIDDRAICFDGAWPSFESIDNFKPWNKR